MCVFGNNGKRDYETKSVSDISRFRNPGNNLTGKRDQGSSILTKTDTICKNSHFSEKPLPDCSKRENGHHLRSDICFFAASNSACKKRFERKRTSSAKIYYYRLLIITKRNNNTAKSRYRFSPSICLENGHHLQTKLPIDRYQIRQELPMTTEKTDTICTDKNGHHLH